MPSLNSILNMAEGEQGEEEEQGGEGEVLPLGSHSDEPQNF